MSSLLIPSHISPTPATTSSPEDSPSTPPKKKQGKAQTIFVGNSFVLEQAKEAITDLTIRFKMDPLASRNPRDLTFVRDSRVIRKDGVHLIPSAISDPLLEGRFKSLLPECSSHFITATKETGYGRGFEETQRTQAIETAKKLKQAYYAAKTCIEGGNCFLTKKGAIVGVHSVILSLVALLEKKQFDEDELDKLAHSIENPQSRFVRMARNDAIYAKRQPYDDKLKNTKGFSPLREEMLKLFGGESGYKKLLTAPITKEEEENNLTAAKKWQACWEKTLEIMADELGIKKKALIIIDQMHFHIDFDIALGPKGLILIQDPKQCINFLTAKTERVKGAALQHFQRFLESMQQKAETHTAIYKSNFSKIKALDLDVVPVPGFFENDSHNINLINGLFLRSSKGLIFATQGASNRYDAELLEIFAETLLQKNIQAVFIDSLQPILEQNHGGLHCLTWNSPFRVKRPKKSMATSSMTEGALPITPLSLMDKERKLNS